MISKTVRFLALSTIALSWTACGKLNNDSDEDQAYLVADSAVSSLNGALNDSEQSNSYALQNHGFSLIQSAYASACGLSRFSPSVGSNCNGTAGDDTVIANFANCTAGRSDEYELGGQVTLIFDGNSTCNTWLAGASLPTSGSVTRTTANFVRTNPNRSVVSVSSASHANYNGATVGGGVTTSFGAGSRTVNILGLHRIRTSARGATVYDHSVVSTAPIVVTGTRMGNNRVVSSGTIRVDHNLAKFSSTASVAGLAWNASCCHPISGTLTFALSGSSSGSIVVDFNTGTCGEATIAKDGSSLGTVDLTTCE